MLVGNPILEKGKGLRIEMFLGEHLGILSEKNKRTFQGRVLGSLRIFPLMPPAVAEIIFIFVITLRLYLFPRALSLSPLKMVR